MSKQLAKRDRRHQKSHAPQGELRECQHPPCSTRTTAQFCIAHSLESDTFGVPPGDGAPNGRPGNRVYRW